jgi:hypothetical protein
MANQLNLTRAICCFSVCFLWTTTAMGQKEPEYEPSFNHTTGPTVEKITSQEIKDRRKPKISTNSEYYLKSRDENDIVLQKKVNEPAKVHIQGRGTMNTIQIIDQQGIPDDQPMWQKDFRGTVYESLDVSKLPDGEYIIKIISPHRTTENKLTIKTLAPE